MSASAKTASGTLYLVPTPLDFGETLQAPLSDSLPEKSLRIAASLDHWICENARTTRAFLKRVSESHPLRVPIQAQQLFELPRIVHKKGDHDGAIDARPWLDAATRSHDMGLVSEAGMPAIADPGTSVVRAAHRLGLSVEPLVGPSSVVLALAAGGMNGQSFAFVGYLPQDGVERVRRLAQLEVLTVRTGQAQVFIETPYRNAKLFQTLLSTLGGNTRLAVCAALTLPGGLSVNRSVSQWREDSGALASVLERPMIFMIGR